MAHIIQTTSLYDPNPNVVLSVFADTKNPAMMLGTLFVTMGKNILAHVKFMSCNIRFVT